ncbi:MAG: branched-chain amino acid ABC transporter permease [Betaproteobacteria bacterium]|nr:branched-chain amino acid ABC transporter permease [Betaproteobacteria bacterium]
MVSPFIDSVLIGIGINVLLALGLYFTLATGQFSVGHGGFMAVGAYTASVATVTLGWPLIPAIGLAALGAFVIGVLIGLPVMRFSHLYLAMATFGFGEIVRSIFSVVDAVGGVGGMRGMVGTSVSLVFALVFIATLFTWLHSRSRWGLACDAIRQDEDAAAAMGIDVRLNKVMAFGLGASITGVGGALYAHHFFFIEPSTFGLNMSVAIVLFVIFGGIETFWGAILGATVLSLLPDLFRFLKDWYLFLYGALFVLLMIFRPQGVLDRRTLRTLRGMLPGSRTK